VLHITDDADGEFGAGSGGEEEGAAEALVLLLVVVLESDLELYGLKEVALVFLGVLDNLLDGGLDVVSGKLAAKVWSKVEDKCR
jgi:hypothetical protein